MNAPRKLAALPPVPEALVAPLRAAIDLAFVIAAADAVVVGPMLLPAEPEDVPSFPSSQPQPIVDRGLARVPILVLHSASWRQRALRKLANLLAEFTVTTDVQLQRDLADETTFGRPATAQWLAAGTCVYDPLGRGRAIVDRATHLLVRGYRPLEAEQAGRRVQALVELNDARTRLASDPVAAELMLARAIEQICDFAIAAQSRWLPPPADRHATLAEIDRAAALLMDACFQGYDLAARLRAVERFADKVLGTRVAPDWVGPRLQAITTGL